ncbi:hypothetical protein ACN47E_002368 [Coniothyrium glycines]
MAANGIPLHCNICPKKPDFSDVSHLLTHIASKGHLSNYYKVKVRSSNEEDSRRLIEAYDRWYSEWGVEELMSERMSQKDRRRTRARPSARSATTSKIEAPVPRPARRTAVGNLLDPRLIEQHQPIKLERSLSPSPTAQPIGPVLRHRNIYAPQLQYWSADSRASSRSYTNADYETSSEYSDPSERQRYRHVAEVSCTIEEDPAVHDPMAVSESTKLKGVYWPGMDIFDSATPEMRRKRNQKKDSSVVEQLELNSLEVEATELIFTPQGSFKRQRRISCSESDEEGELDIKIESPDPVRRRTALAYLDANIRGQRQQKRPAFFRDLHGQYDDQNCAGFGLSQGSRISKRKLFEVFQDQCEEVAFSQPAHLNYLTAGFTHKQPQYAVAATTAYKYHDDPFSFENKENAAAMFHHPAIGNLHAQQSNNYHYAGYLHDLGHGHGHGSDHTGPQFHGYMYSANEHDQHEDDQRTLTAPPSPSTG